MAMEVITPKIRGFICINAHPAGCAKNISEQIKHVVHKVGSPSGSLKVLVIGASTGYGLSSRIAAAFGYNAKTIGVFFERPPEDGKIGSAGFYNTTAFHQEAKAKDLYARSINGDAFSDAIKQQTFDAIRNDLGKVDYVIYSLASPRRIHPRTGKTHSSTLKPIGQSYTSKTVDLNSGKIQDITIQPASEQEIADTIAVMGGEDWSFWIDGLLENNLLNQGARTVAYSYIGPELTWAIYRSGTIGKAKEDLEKTGHELNKILQQKVGGSAWVSINKALVTQASAAIPVVPLYISALYRIMKDRNLHEGCIEQMTRLFQEHIAPGKSPKLDAEGRIRLDDLEMRPEVQSEVANMWKKLTNENFHAETDFGGYRREFRNLFGFEVEGVDYSKPVETQVSIS